MLLTYALTYVRDPLRWGVHDAEADAHQPLGFWSEAAIGGCSGFVSSIAVCPAEVIRRPGRSLCAAIVLAAAGGHLAIRHASPFRGLHGRWWCGP